MKKDPRLIDVLRDDLRRGDFKRTVKKDFLDLKEFMLDDDRHKRLSEMGKIRRWFYLVWWMLKSLFLKLTPARRLFLILALLMLFLFQDIRFTNSADDSVTINFSLIGGLALLFVLMLELKDKLIAREELEAGHAVQKALMPERNPKVEGWKLWLYSRSANEVGGDLVDFMNIDGGRYLATLADVAGKGLSAALLTAKLQATVRALAPDYQSLHEFAAKLNRIFSRDSLPNIFASLVCVEFHPESDNIEFVNAGHLPPVLVRGDKVQSLEKGGAALGILHNAVYKKQTAELHKGEVMILYSDGLVEARNEKGDFFGDQQFFLMLPQISHLSSEHIGEQIMVAIDRFIGDAKPHDDISIAILKRE